MLHIKNLSFSYGSTPLLQHIDLKVKAGEIVALTGLSGSGKSTLLKLIYGSVAPKEGQMSWKKKPLLGPDYNLLPGADFMRYLAQDFDLMPFTSVAENISQHLSVFEPEQLTKRTQELLELIDMTDFAQTKIRLLSGGQQQRVALAKALAKAPELLLLDEPFSHIDVPLKQELREQLYAYLHKHNIACIMATHDPEDFMGHAHKMICLEQGQISASDKPQSLYERPPSHSVAQLFGSLNVVEPKLLKHWHNRPQNTAQKTLLLWPHELRFSKNRPMASSKMSLAVQVTGSVFKGDGYLISLMEIQKNNRFYVRQKKSVKIGTPGYLWVSLRLCEEKMAAIKEA